MIEDLKNKIKEANAAYRAGNPIMSDGEYDALLEKLELAINRDEYEYFVSTLNEGAIETNIDGKVKHPYIMGSLDKLKYEEPEEIVKWLNANIKEGISISAKVDGISSRAEYKNGKLVSLTTRGDGYMGMDITSKAKYIKFLPAEIEGRDFTGNIRGELVIFKSDFEIIKDKYANPRNACAGIMNRKDGDKKFNESELRLISFVPYAILGDEYTKGGQFDLLESMGFNHAMDTTIRKEGAFNLAFVEELFNMTNSAIAELPYEIDGLVICDWNWKNEDGVYRPDGCKAFKTNQSVGITKVVGFDWGTPSANGKFTPVALLEPIQLAGTTVSRVTCNNITWMEKMGVEIGKTVKILKAGEIIPKIIEVLD